MATPFTESVALEKEFWKPLPENASASSVLRRRFFQGHWLTAEDGVALGQTNGLVGAAIRAMEDWGFEFETNTIEDGKKRYRLKNPQHIPTERKQKRPRGPSRNRESLSTRSGTPAHRAVREKLLTGEEITCGDSMAMGASSAFLRKEVVRLQGEGYKFHIVGHGVDRTYRLTRAPKGQPQPTNNGHDDDDGDSRGKALSKTPVGRVPVVSNGQALSDSLFGSLATPPPMLGSHIRVIGMMLDEDDEGGETIKLALKNGTGTWTANIEGYADAEQQ